ncbi:MAG TPA: hypothetical protein VGL48_18335 [Acidimicrobiales bacterium]
MTNLLCSIAWVAHRDLGPHPCYGPGTGPRRPPRRAGPSGPTPTSGPPQIGTPDSLPAGAATSSPPGPTAAGGASDLSPPTSGASLAFTGPTDGVLGAIYIGSLLFLLGLLGKKLTRRWSLLG